MNNKIIQEAKDEIAQEDFREKVDRYKISLRKKKSWWRFFPKITITWSR